MEIAKHGFSTGTIETWIVGFVLLIVLFNIVSGFFPDLTTAGNTLNSSGFPLASLFTSGGAGWYILAMALILLVFKMLSPGKRK